MIDQFLAPLQKEEDDEYTEYQACFSIPGTKDYVGLVYWKAALLNYEYILVTFTKKGVLIDQQVIAGTQAKGNIIARTVAKIDEDLNIFIVGGVENTEEKEIDGTDSEALELFITESGQIQPVPH